MRSRYRHRLPQAAGGLFIAVGAGGVSASDGSALASTDDLAGTPLSRRVLARRMRRAARAAFAGEFGFIAETATMCANAAWGEACGTDDVGFAEMNRQSVGVLERLRDEVGMPGQPMVLSGSVGPAPEAATPADADEAERLHTPQIATFAETAADLVTGVAISSVAEAIGIARAARTQGLPVAISFAVDEDGRIAGGERLAVALAAVDAATGAAPAYYMAEGPGLEVAATEPGARLLRRRLAGVRFPSAPAASCAARRADADAEFGRLRELFERLCIFGEAEADAPGAERAVQDCGSGDYASA
jgi:homocysteine S-methyltransferase